MPGYHTFYSGSTVLLPLADFLGLRVDQVNFVVCQVVSLILAAFYYRYLPPKKVSSTIRLTFPFVIGILMCYFCFGPAIKHLLADGIICYLMIRYSPTQHVHKIVFVFAMLYLSYIHFFRVYHARNYLIDITGPMMVLTQKVTCLAFNVHDGTVKDKSELSILQKKELVRKIPNILEYLSYVYNFYAILCGPLSSFADYIDFIEGNHYRTKSDELVRPSLNNNDAPRTTIEPSPWKAVVEKLFICAACLLVNVYVTPFMPAEAVLDINGFFTKIGYLVISLTLLRSQYYYAWVMADAINNAAGFGFNGYDSNGKAKWDLVTNVNIWNVEASDNIRDSLACWNSATVHWLRIVAYDRTPHRYRTVATYFVSAWWHGFFPGYYATFLTGALFTEAARRGRRYIRPYFLGSPLLKFVYDCITFVCSRLAIAYAGITFVLLHTNATITIYRQLYFFMHIAAIVLLFVVPKIIPKKEVVEERKSLKKSS